MSPAPPDLVGERLDAGCPARDTQPRERVSYLGRGRVVLGQAAGQEPLRDRVALGGVARIPQPLDQLGPEGSEEILELDELVAQLARRDAEQPPRFEHVEVELIAGLLTVVARAGPAAPPAGRAP